MEYRDPVGIVIQTLSSAFRGNLFCFGHFKGKTIHLTEGEMGRGHRTV